MSGKGKYDIINIIFLVEFLIYTNTKVLIPSTNKVQTLGTNNIETYVIVLVNKCDGEEGILNLKCVIGWSL